MSRFIYEFFRWVALITGWPMQLVAFTRKTYYEDKSVQNRFVKGGALIISNHYSVFDYMVNLFLFPFRKLHVVYWAQAGTKQYPWIRRGMKFFGGIPSDREAMAMRFIDDSVRVIEKGELVQIYPEAHITPDGKMHEFKPSYLLIALRADAPILPVITDGNYGLFRRVHVIIGKPIDLWEYCSSDEPSREELAEMNRIVYEKCKKLKAELDARIAADHKIRRNRKEEL